MTLDGDRVSLLGSRCLDCGETFFGLRPACEHCASEHLEDITLSGRGTIHSATVVRYPPPGDFRGARPAEPYDVCIVELPEGVRILTRMTGIRAGASTIGMHVNAMALPVYQDDDGETVATYAFGPSTEGLAT